MPILKKSERLSNLFSSSSEPTPPPEPPATNGSHKLSKRPQERLSSAQLAPPVAYPTQQQLQQPQYAQRPTVTTVQSELGSPLAPPPITTAEGPVDRRSSSPGFGGPINRPGSQVGTPTGASASTGHLSPVPTETPKSSKRRSFFGVFKDDKKDKDASQPLAWVAGHADQVPYNIALLLSGEPVSAHLEMFEDPVLCPI